MAWMALVMPVAKMVGQTVGLEAPKTAGREFGKRVGPGKVDERSGRPPLSVEVQIGKLRERVDASELEMVKVADQIAATSERLRRRLERSVVSLP